MLRCLPFVPLMLVFVFSTYAATPKRSAQGPVAPVGKIPAEEHPTAKTKVVDVPEEVKWDFMIWTDASGKRQLRAKLLSFDGDQLHMQRPDGSDFDVALDRFCKEDHELVSQVHLADTNKHQVQEERKALRDAIKEALESFSEETALRRAELVREREKAFLKTYDGRMFDLVFPVTDISPYQQRNVRNDLVTVSGCYDLRLGREETRDGVQRAWNQVVKISAAEAARVTKGDQLIVSGKGSFVFGPSGEEYQKAWLSWTPHSIRGEVFSPSGGNSRILILKLENPRFIIQRSKNDPTLKDKVEARALQLKAIKAKEKVTGLKRSDDPFED